MARRSPHTQQEIAPRQALTILQHVLDEARELSRSPTHEAFQMWAPSAIDAVNMALERRQPNTAARFCGECDQGLGVGLVQEYDTGPIVIPAPFLAEKLRNAIGIIEGAVKLLRLEAGE